MSEAANRMVGMTCRVVSESHPRRGALVLVVGVDGDKVIAESLDSYSRNMAYEPAELRQVYQKTTWEFVE